LFNWELILFYSKIKKIKNNVTSRIFNRTIKVIYLYNNSAFNGKNGTHVFISLKGNVFDVNVKKDSK
jgi:hypothetical protein